MCKDRNEKKYRVITNIRTKDKLEALLNSDLSFRDGKRYLIHNLHSFAAKFPPQLPNYFIKNLTLPGDIILDPMVGSGVTVVEAWLLGRKAFGVDLDPLARLISRVRTREYDIDSVIESGNNMLVNAKKLVQLTYLPQTMLSKFDESTKDFINYWFSPSTQIELAAIILAIREEKEEKLQELLTLIFSSIIVTKSGGVSFARDLAHSRPHRVDDKVIKSAFTLFSYQFTRAIKAIKEIELIPKGNVEVIKGDSRVLPFLSDSIDLIVTSPPYANALDYMRAHKFSLVWLGEKIKNLSLLRSQYIGSEKWGNGYNIELPIDVSKTISNIEQKDVSKAKILKKYYYDMELVLKEMFRVLKNEHVAVVVVGPSTMRGLKIETHNHLALIAQELGFILIDNVCRPIDRNRRMMPIGKNVNGNSIIEQRMHEEYVIGLYKP